MRSQRYKVELSDSVLEFLRDYSKRSTQAKLDVGAILEKAETFDRSGIEECNATSEIRCVGQHEVLPISCRSLFAFVELRRMRTESEILFATEVSSFADLRHSWERVYTHFGYDPQTPDAPVRGYFFYL